MKALRMGALLVLPQSININSLGLETEPVKILARAFQNYGVYLVDDTTWDVVAIETEYGPDGSVRNEFKKSFNYDFDEISPNTPWARDIARIFANLSVVDNNDEFNIGGGPTSDTINRLAPMAGKLSTSYIPTKKNYSSIVYDLQQNFPNPFNTITTITYSIQKQLYVELIVYDMLSRKITTLVQEEQEAGEYKIKFDGSTLTNGIYIYSIQAGKFRESKKLVILK